MHVLSLGTWWIHIASVIEWCLAIVLLEQRGLRGMALAMLPALVSAMAACEGLWCCKPASPWSATQPLPSLPCS